MIEVFQLLEGIENVYCNQFFSSATTCYALRGHERKLLKTRSILDARKFFFTLQPASGQHLDSIPASVVQASSVNMFKNVYDKHLAGEWTPELIAASPSTYKYE